MLFVGQFYWVVLGGFGGLMEIVGVCDALLGDFWRRGWFVVDCGSSWTDVQFILVVVNGCGW